MKNVEIHQVMNIAPMQELLAGAGCCAIIIFVVYYFFVRKGG